MVKHLAATARTVILGLWVRYVGPENPGFVWNINQGSCESRVGKVLPESSYPRAARPPAPRGSPISGVYQTGTFESRIGQALPEAVNSGLRGEGPPQISDSVGAT